MSKVKKLYVAVGDVVREVKKVHVGGKTKDIIDTYRKIAGSGETQMTAKNTFTIEVPNWCKIGLYIEWYAPMITGKTSWVREKIISYGYDGFFHQAPYCPVYFTKFSEYGKTVRLEEGLK